MNNDPYISRDPRMFIPGSGIEKSREIPEGKPNRFSYRNQNLFEVKKQLNNLWLPTFMGLVWPKLKSGMVLIATTKDYA